MLGQVSGSYLNPPLLGMTLNKNVLKNIGGEITHGILLNGDAQKIKVITGGEITCPQRRSLLTGRKNVSNIPLVNPEDVLLPPLHIKLGLIKNFVKAMDRNGDGFLYLKEKFPKTSEPKIKEGIFVGPQ
jgi:hypothetical protein